ncbi:hypothetical protein AB205_0124830 [Aquarana catesbeiana]|uniref:Uncharacterized protein n=1 Tax=Aquarana catesbeiana TaxID=8400 RepID=A0A2G9R659_AQUCT|nr:hypothetical protein AB205_0124830 [Aquarana catesbeiana]
MESLVVTRTSVPVGRFPLLLFCEQPKFWYFLLISLLMIMVNRTNREGFSP